MSDALVGILVGLFFPLAISGFFYLILGLISRNLERTHEEDLARREAAVANSHISDLRGDPAAATADFGQLVTGSVVMGTGARRQFTASIRTIFGGEVKGFQRVLQAARREAQLRMIEDAVSQGATGVINVRFETSQVGSPQKPSSEILAYGTMIK